MGKLSKAHKIYVLVKGKITYFDKKISSKIITRRGNSKEI